MLPGHIRHECYWAGWPRGGGGSRPCDRIGVHPGRPYAAVTGLARVESGQAQPEKGPGRTCPCTSGCPFSRKVLEGNNDDETHGEKRKEKQHRGKSSPLYLGSKEPNNVCGLEAMDLKCPRERLKGQPRPQRKSEERTTQLLKVSVFLEARREED